MTLCLVPMTASAIAEFAARQFESYITSRITSGEPADQARRHAAWEWNKYFPDQVAAPGHRLYWLHEGDERVGLLWLGPTPNGRANAEWIFYVEVDEHLRGRGLGRAAMLLAEQDAAAHGAVELGLNVFGDNVIAQRLYHSVGYRTTAMNMVKELGQTAE